MSDLPKNGPEVTKSPATPESIAGNAAKHVEWVFDNNRDGSATRDAFTREIQEHPQEAQAIWKEIAKRDAATHDNVERFLAGSWAQDQFDHHPGALGDDIYGLASDKLKSAAQPDSPPTTPQGMIDQMSAQWLFENSGSVSASATAAIGSGLNTDNWYIAPSEATAITTGLNNLPGWKIKPPPDQLPTWGDYFKRMFGSTGGDPGDG